MSKNEEEVHVVMLPWLAFGHMIPYFELSIALAKSGVHVSFLSTPRNIQRLPKIPPNLSPLIHFVPLPLPKLHNNPLPENAEATVDIPADKMDHLKIACDLLQEPIENFIAKNPPNWIIVDFFHHWAVDIAQDFNIPLIRYVVTTATAAVFFWAPEFLDSKGQLQARPSPQHLTAPPNWVDFPSQVACRNNEATAMHNVVYGLNASGIPDGARVTRLVQASQAVAIRTCPEFEGDYLDVYSKITGKPVFPVGFLPPENPKERRTIINEAPWDKIFDWLDQQKPSSVVFVGFGSETKLSKDQIHEIAHGFELSRLPFIWALRKPDNDDDNGDPAAAAALPPGFCTRTAGRGVVHVGWAPQREILGHPSVGGSFFHAGWGSIIEAMQYGHVLVFLPFVIDQPLNARLMVEKGLGVEVERGEDGIFTRNDVANALRKAMGDSEEGPGTRARADEGAQWVFGDQELHRSYVEKFAEYLRNHA